MNFKGKITSYGYDGEGVLRLDGKVVFLPFALMDEEVEYEITQARSSFSRGKVIKILSPSADRQIPPCPYFGRCGGCCYQHTSYKNELEIKRLLFQNQLKKVGFEGEIQVMPSSDEYGYRNKITLFVGEEGLSLKMRGTSKLCKISKCLLVTEKLNEAITIIDNFILHQNLQQEIEKVVLRQESDIILVNFILKNAKTIHYQGLFLLLGTHCGIFETVDGECRYVLGLQQIECDEFNLKCVFGMNSFHQVNRYVGASLYSYIDEIVKGQDIINCYSGAGVLSGLLANSGRRVRAIELGLSEHADAQRLKENNNLFLLTNYQGDCGEWLGKLCDLQTPDTIIVDPPRSGMDEKVVRAISQSKAKTFIYISCDSATLVRDLQRLEGYKIKSAKLFDMFARTGEYESVVLLEKK